MKIKRNDMVSLNCPVRCYGITYPIGTIGRVYKVQRNGKLRISTERHSTLEINANNVTFVSSQIIPQINVGDIFNSSWGYDQTNIDFYQIVSVSGKSVWYRKLKSDQVRDGFMCGTCTPIKDNFTDVQVSMARIGVYDDKPYFKITSYACAYPWDGKPQRFSEYA